MQTSQKTIARNAVLRELDIKENPGGKPRTFSIRFCLRSGETVFIPRAVTSGTGINRNQAVNRERGFLPVDVNYRSTGHVYPVNIDNILEYNNMLIKL
jgi:hypothetical protein